MSESEARTTGRTIAGQYHLLSELGRGGMGTVWLADDTVTGRRVAVKELRPPGGSSDDERGTYMQRAYSEARSAAQISHPNAVTLHHVIPATANDDTIYLVMEFVDGPTLAGLVSRHGGSLASPLVAKIGLELLDVLTEAHQLGIVHRDIKPGNVLIARGERAKLTDFGIAHVLGGARITRGGGVAGTLAYMAPEMFEGRDIAASSDLWSLGATLFYAVAGWAPFDRDTDAATMRAILTDPVPVPGCDPALAEAISGLLRRDPDQRLTADEASRLLRRVREQEERTPMWQGRAVPIGVPAPSVPAPPHPSSPSNPAYPPHPSNPSGVQAQPGTRLDAPAGATGPRQPADPGTGPGTGPGQPKPGSRRRTVIIASSAAAAVVVLAGATVGILLGTMHHGGGGQSQQSTGNAPPLAAKGPALKAPGGGSATSLSFNADGTMLAAADNTSPTGANKAPEWNASSGTQTSIFPYFGTSTGLAFSPSGQMLAVAGADLYLWNAAKHVNTVYRFDTIPRCLAFSPDSKTLVVGGQLRAGSTPVVRLLNAASGQWTATLPGLPGTARVSGVAFSPDGRTVAASDPATRAVYLWNVSGKSLSATVKPGGVTGPIAFSPDGRTLAVAAGPGQVKLIDAASKQTVSTVTDPGSKGVKALAFSHDGRALAVADGNGMADVWNAASGKMTAQAAVPGADSVAFNPAGTILATGSGSGQVRMWTVPAR
ncbi:MAG: serine/threonine-protein kinase [Streptosporangiales bacterium]|nr:serine/threonine-protein kinase [Streptosporangiales bacterium]